MENHDVIINFKYRRTLPSNPLPGSFYWVEIEDGSHKVYFSPDENKDNLILLNNDLSDLLKGLEGKKFINNIIKTSTGYTIEISDGTSIDINNDLSSYATQEWVEDKLKDVSPKYYWRKI